MSLWRRLWYTAMAHPSRAVEAMYWFATGRRQRARNRLRLGIADSAHAYRLWQEEAEPPRMNAAQIAAQVAQWDQPPRISVIVHLRDRLRAAAITRMLAALAVQSYPHWELVLVCARGIQTPRLAHAPRIVLTAEHTNSPARAIAIAMQAASGDHILPLAEEAQLTSDALFHLAAAMRDNSGACVAYADQDECAEGAKRQAYWFKPQWNPDLFLAQDYLSGICLIRADAVRAHLPLHPARADAAVYALLLAITGGKGAQVLHVPRVLAHLPSAQARRGVSAQDAPARAAAVARHVMNAGGVARIGPHGTVGVEWPLPDPPPLVSILIPTRDGLDLLRLCITGVLHHTDYPAIEVLIIDNGSVQADTLDWLDRITADPRVRVLRDDGPFNFAALNNGAAAQARGEYLCMLNNDIEVLEPGWLTALMRQAVRPHVGAVGARLLYEDGSVQHAGVTIGLGDAAGHAHRFERGDDPGYFARSHAQHSVSAVTAACLVVARHKFAAVGGFDAEHLAVAFNDVDLCLKLRAAGWTNIYEPAAELIHHESKSRGRDTSPQHIARYRAELAVLQRRWGTVDHVDPLHHPQLDRMSERYRLKLP
ncbi:glycosyltransferase [Novosphingobium sp. FSY-8]|uniref:Glycosyltransferase n=1 Tax=Novosphingobium ovatum TaxID=1908523 RepID=A0ABW9XEE9_9SPHN|nr:glycosyltransferase family 2 protein [Novosphingobium ovatum]NBC36901.1 glycosyltransferase [Novosphingobium ovatum]